MCENKGAAVSVQLERSLQLARLTKTVDKSAEATEGVWRDLIETTPVKSLTMDRGGEGGNQTCPKKGVLASFNDGAYIIEARDVREVSKILFKHVDDCVDCVISASPSPAPCAARV